MKKGGKMGDPEALKRTERVKIRIRYSCATNSLQEPDYFEDYYEEKWVTQKVKR
jgi:hypothetical protein